MPQTALLTGATGGLGRAYADGLAARGFDLILTARKADALDDLANELRGRRGTHVTTIAADLGDANDRRRFIDGLAAHRVDLLLNNAGYGDIGEFAGTDAGKQTGMVEVNCQALVELTHFCLRPMLERGRGTIVNVASTAAFQPVPTMAVYAATKAFVLSFTQALRDELRDTPVQVIGVCPGPTETAFFDVAGNADAAKAVRRTPEDVVRTTFRGLDQKKAFVIDGFTNRAGAWLGLYAPRDFVMWTARKLMQG